MNSRPCKACGRKLAFGRTPEGKLIPLDLVSPVYQVLHDFGSDGIEVERLPAAYVSHFATCPEAGRFSKRNRPGGT